MGKETWCKRTTAVGAASGAGNAVGATAQPEYKKKPWKGNSKVARSMHFNNQRDAALAVLNSTSRLTRKSGQFLGQLAVDPSPLSERQAEWLGKLLCKAGLPPLAGGGL